MTRNDALQLRDRFFRCETSAEEERTLVALLLSDDCPEELLADRHAIITLAREEARPNGLSPLPLPCREGSNYSQKVQVVQKNSSKTLETGLSTPLPTREGQGGESVGLRRIAAAVAVIVLAGGLALAAIQLASSPKPSPQSCLVGGDSIAANRTEANEEQAVRFENARLDSVLAVVAAHYGCAVSFIDEQPRRLRLSTTWQPARPLSDFTSLMNELDGLHLTVNKDTIVVSGKPIPAPSL